MELLVFQSLTFFAKSSALQVWKGSEYASDIFVSYTFLLSLGSFI